MVGTSRNVPTIRPDDHKPGETTKPVTAPKSKVERIANEAAHKAAKHEQEYDQGHTTISK
jgi:hypothetical protein